MPRRVAGLLALAALLAGCGGTTPTSSLDVPSASASREPSLSLRDAGVEPTERPQAAIGFAFTADEAADLVAGSPIGIDFGTDALLCVYLGERPSGWSLDLRTASLADGELRILARENEPRGVPPSGQSHPADCALIDRAALPPGRLPVRADDLNSDEFIVDAVVTVPAAGAGP
jgi:hypothetical protein